MKLTMPLALAAAGLGAALAAQVGPAGAAVTPGWSLSVGGGVSEAHAESAGGRLVMTCATQGPGGAKIPRYAIRLEGPPHGGRPLKAQLDVGPTHYNLDLTPTAQPNASAWTARNPKDERAYRALAARIRTANAPVKVKVNGASALVFPARGAKETLGTQSLQCLV